MAAPQLKPVTEGWTEPIEQQLLNDGVPINIQGMTVVLFLQDTNGTPVTTTGKVTNLDDGTEINRGKVQFSPGSSDLLLAGTEYYWKWRVTDGSGKNAFWPNGEAYHLSVWPVGRG